MFEVIGDAVRGEDGAEGEKGWDSLVGDLQDDESVWDVDSNDLFVQALE